MLTTRHSARIKNSLVRSLQSEKDFHFFIGQIFCAMFFQNLTGSILCIRHLTEKKNRLIGFIFICQQVTKLCAFPKQTGSTPSASGSRVPVCPIFFCFTIPRSFATTSWDV